MTELRNTPLHVILDLKTLKRLNDVVRPDRPTFRGLFESFTIQLIVEVLVYLQGSTMYTIAHSCTLYDTNIIIVLLFL